MAKIRLSRRGFLKAGGVVAAAAAAASLPSWMPRLAFAQPYNQPRGDVLVSIFLRGGADALNMVVPHGDEAYYEARPRLAIARPDTLGSDPKVLDLDGFFGLHPSLAPLLPIFEAGGMKAIHGTGSPHETRSHFEAMDFMERGTPGEYGVNTGWIARHLMSLGAGETDSPVRGVGWGVSVQAALGGAPSTIAMQSIVDYHLAGDQRLVEPMMTALMGMYTLTGGDIGTSALGTQAAIEVIRGVGYEGYLPRGGATYPESAFGMALRQTAALIRAQVGLEVSCIDLGGWDTHANQGGVEGTQARLLGELSAGLAAFYADMSDMMGGISVVVMSEFGRRLSENANNGTDHGRGGAMLLMGSGYGMGERVIARWPGLGANDLDDGDLAVTLDYRDVLAELIRVRLRNGAIGEVFPNHTAQSLGLFV